MNPEPAKVPNFVQIIDSRESDTPGGGRIDTRLMHVLIDSGALKEAVAAAEKGPVIIPLSLPLTKGGSDVLLIETFDSTKENEPEKTLLFKKINEVRKMNASKIIVPGTAPIIAPKIGGGRIIGG